MVYMGDVMSGWLHNEQSELGMVKACPPTYRGWQVEAGRRQPFARGFECDDGCPESDAHQAGQCASEGVPDNPDVCFRASKAHY